MGKSFSDLLANAGYGTQDVSNPAVLRDIPEEGIGAGTSSDSTGSDQGPTLRFMNELNQKTVKNIPATAKNKINRDPELNTLGNPFTDPKEKEVTSVAEATSGKRVRPPRAVI